MDEENRLKLHAQFFKGLRKAYFADKTDIDSQWSGPEKKEAFSSLMNLIEKYPRARKKAQIEDKIETLLRKDPYLTTFYQILNGKKEDFITRSFDCGEPALAISLMKFENKLQEKIKSSLESYAARQGDKDYDTDTDNDTLTQPELILAMFGTKDAHFCPDNNPQKDDIAALLIKEFNLNPHKVISVGTENGDLKTTPFMYFLERHRGKFSDTDDYSSIVPSTTSHHIPVDIDSKFYASADFDFEDFEGNDIPKALSAAGFKYFAQIAAKKKTHHEETPNQSETKPEDMKKKNKKRTDTMTMPLPGFENY